MSHIKHSAEVPYSATQMFDLVNAIESYPQFIPWCTSAEVLLRNDDEIRAKLTFTRGGMSKSFTTCNRLQKGKMIEMRLIDGPFKHLEGFWRFETQEKSGCKILFDAEFEFTNPLLSMAFGLVFYQVADKLVDVFCDRAKQVY